MRGTWPCLEGRIGRGIYSRRRRRQRQRFLDLGIDTFTVRVIVVELRDASSAVRRTRRVKGLRGLPRRRLEGTSFTVRFAVPAGKLCVARTRSPTAATPAFFALASSSKMMEAGSSGVAETVRPLRSLSSAILAGTD